MAYLLVPRRHARLPRARHDPPALRRRLGRRHPPAARRGRARAAGHDACSSCRSRSACATSTRGRNADLVAHDAVAAAQAAVPERAVLPRRAPRSTSSSGTRSSYFLNALVARAGPDRRSAARAPDAAAERRRAARLRPDDDVRVVRLADVARAALVLDDLRRADHRRPGAVGARVPDHRARRGSAAAPPLDRDRRRRALPRPRQPDARLRDAVGVLLVLAVPDHLVGQPAGGDRLVPAPAADRLARRRRRAGRRSTSPCRSSLLLSRDGEARARSCSSRSPSASWSCGSSICSG